MAEVTLGDAVSAGSTATRDERGGGAVAFAGYAAVFDVVDRAGDVMRRGAFRGAGVVPLLWQHRGEAVGSLASVREDARGLRVEGMVADPELAGLVRAGAVAGLSVGYAGEVPTGYSLRGGDWGLLDRVLVRVAEAEPGDVLLMAVGPGQIHLGIRTERGFVHADAGLRRVVERPGVPPWPILSVWRMGV